MPFVISSKGLIKTKVASLLEGKLLFHGAQVYRHLYVFCCHLNLISIIPFHFQHTQICSLSFLLYCCGMR